MPPTLTISGPIFIPWGGTGTYTVTVTGDVGAGVGLFCFPDPSDYWWPPSLGSFTDGTFTFVFTPPLSNGPFDVYCFDVQHDVYSNHLLVQVGVPEPDWHLFPIQPDNDRQQDSAALTLTQSWKQPATLTCSFLDPDGLLTPENKTSAYNLNGDGEYDPLLDEARKILLRVGVPCYPNLAAGIVPTCSLSLSNAAYLTDDAFGTISDSSANYAEISPVSSNPFTLTLDLGAAYFLRHAVIRFASKVSTCTLPASVAVQVSQDGSTWTAFKSARPVGGTGGDGDDDYIGINVEVIFADLDDVMARMPGNNARYLRFVVTPTGAQTLLLDELAVYGATKAGGYSQGRTILGHNLFVGYLGDKIEVDALGNPTVTATDVLKKLQDNNEVLITAQYNSVDVGDILYDLLTSGAYWEGRLTDYDAPFTGAFIGWQPQTATGTGLTGMVYPAWQSQGGNLLDYAQQLVGAIGWYLYADGNGAVQMIEPPYQQRTADRILIADDDGNLSCRECQRHRTGKQLRNVWEASSGQQLSGGGRIVLEEPNSVAKYGRRRTIITDPIATTGDLLTKVCEYGIREYAWRLQTLTATISPFFEDRPKRIHGLRASLRPNLHSKSNGTSWDRELWSVDGLTHRIGHGRWDAVAEYAPYFPLGSLPPTLLSGSLGMSETSIPDAAVTFAWETITDPSVAFVNIYRSTSANGTLGLPEVQPSTFSLLAQVAVGTTTYTDTGSIDNGVDYWYYLTTVDTFGTESVPSVVLWARPGTGNSTTNDWVITDLEAAWNQTQAPANGIGYYTYEIYLTFTSPGPTPDTGAGGLKRFNMYYALGNSAPSTADLSLFNYTDQWDGIRVKPAYQPIGMDAADQTPGRCQWYMRFRSLTSLAGQTAWVLLVTSDKTTSMDGFYRSNVVPVVLH